MLASGLLESGAADAHDARGWLRDCRKVGLLMLLRLGVGFEMQEKGMADAAVCWLRDCWKVRLLMLMMLGVGFETAGKWGC